jgi:hypothetical protein
VADVSEYGFGKPFNQSTVAQPASYDFRTQHAGLFGATGPYQYSKRETIQAVRSYAQSEPLKVAGEPKGQA